MNGDLANAPETLNRDPYGAGWMLRLQPAGNATAELGRLLDAGAYGATLA